jgi:RNA polymerase sigma factor (sigma-70 family)
MEKRIVKQDEFLKAYDELSQALFRHCFFRVSNREVALDMVQDGFTKTWQHLVAGNEIKNLKAFLYQVMNNLIIDYYRKSKSLSLDALMEDGFDSSDKTVNTESSAELALVMRALPQLERHDREVIVFRHIDGLSVGEIAEIIGESENVVSVRLHRALKKLKEVVNPETS